MSGYEKSRDYGGDPVTWVTYVWAAVAVLVLMAVVFAVR